MGNYIYNSYIYDYVHVFTRTIKIFSCWLTEVTSITDTDDVYLVYVKKIVEKSITRTRFF